jgi:putative ABC transport system substrate-binding protein
MAARGLRTQTLLVVLVLLLVSVRPAVAEYRIATVLSSRLQPYVEALQGFRDTIGAAVPVHGPKSITYAEITEYVLAEEPSRASLRRKILAGRPDLLLAVGTNALAFLRSKDTDIPIVYLMVPYPAGIVNGRPNITGVNLQISPARQLAALLTAAPDLKNFGLLYDPLRSGPMLKEIEAAARQKNITLIARQARTSSEVDRLLNEMIGRIDCFWMLPDLTVVTPQTVELILLFSLEHRVPIFSFSTKYLTRGAAFAIIFDNYDLGRSGAEMAMKILVGHAIEAVPPIEPQRIQLRTNHYVIEKLGIPMSVNQGNTP